MLTIAFRAAANLDLRTRIPDNAPQMVAAASWAAPIERREWSEQMAQASTFGQRVRQQLRLRDAPPSLITRSLRGIDLAVTETQDDNPVPCRSGSVADEA